MGKYDPLWQNIAHRERRKVTLSFAEIGAIAGVPIDHSFLRAKKELESFGWRVGPISLKKETVDFLPLEPGA